MSIRAVVLSALLLAVPFVARAVDPVEVERKVAELDAHSKKLFGVSLNSLRYLIDANPNHFFPMWHLEKTGDIVHIRELESKGYISTQVRTGLPDGGEPNVKFLRIIPMGAGLEVQRCVLALNGKK